jgi:hypothetical protein
LRQERSALLLVHPAIITAQGKPRDLDIRILPVDALGESVLSVHFDGPPRDSRWPMSYRLQRSDVWLDAAALVKESKDGLLVALPDLRKGETVPLAVGWYGGEFEHYRVRHDLTTERGPQSAEWLGYIKGNASANRLCQPAPST